MNFLQCFSRISLCLLLSFSFYIALAQADNRVQYFEASEAHYGGLFTYSTITGEISIYYAENDKWVKESSIAPLKLSIIGRDFRMQFLSGNSTTLPGLFIYSTTSGAYEFFYLEDGFWKPNAFLPSSKSNLSSNKVRMDYTPAANGTSNYITIYATDKNEFEIVYLNDNNWVASELFPQKNSY